MRKIKFNDNYYQSNYSILLNDILISIFEDEFKLINNNYNLKINAREFREITYPNRVLTSIYIRKRLFTKDFYQEF